MAQQRFTAYVTEVRQTYAKGSQHYFSVRIGQNTYWCRDRDHIREIARAEHAKNIVWQNCEGKF